LLSNAVSLSSSWRDEFPDELTQDALFHLLDGTTVTVQMMVSQFNDRFRHISGDGYDAMELMCLADDLAMVLVLPEAGRFAEVEDRLDGFLLAEVLAGLAPTSLSISLPKWATRSRLHLDDVLGALGVADAFSPLADFSGITGNVDLRMGPVVHEANIAVDEIGINATAGSLGISDGTPDRVVFDRPFLFLLRDTETGAILFAGRVLNPADG
jgi:serpin B